MIGGSTQCRRLEYEGHHASDKKGCHQLYYNHFDSCRFGFFLFVENMYGNATLLFVILSNYLQNFCTLDKNGNHHVHNTFEKGNLMYFLDNAYTKEIRQYNFNGKKRLSSYIENF